MGSTNGGRIEYRIYVYVKGEMISVGGNRTYYIIFIIDVLESARAFSTVWCRARTRENGVM